VSTPNSSRADVQARYCIRFVPKSGQLVLKITDDVNVCFLVFIAIRFQGCTFGLRSMLPRTRGARANVQCIMYKTFSSIILNRFEALNLRLLSQIANVRPKARPINTGSGDAGTPAAVADEDDPMLGTGPADAAKGAAAAGIERTGTPAGASKAGGGGKKKKKGKK